MKIAYISDLHLEVDDPRDPKINLVLSRDETMLARYGFPDAIEADVLIIAGDLHPDMVVRSIFLDTLERAYHMPVLYVPGNHCCWYGDLARAHQAPLLVRIGGHTIGLATLWTRLTPHEEVLSWRFSDFQRIIGMTNEVWNKLHQEHLAALTEWQPDVIVTHHAPFVDSISDGFQGDPFNGFFVNSRIDPMAFPNTKVWIHGHVHQVHDYLIEGIQVVCNPKGYYMEQLPTIIRTVEI